MSQPTITNLSYDQVFNTVKEYFREVGNPLDYADLMTILEAMRYLCGTLAEIVDAIPGAYLWRLSLALGVRIGGYKDEQKQIGAFRAANDAYRQRMLDALAAYTHQPLTGDDQTGIEAAADTAEIARGRAEVQAKLELYRAYRARFMSAIRAEGEE